MGEHWRIALIDSGVSSGAASSLVAARRFVDTQGEVDTGPPSDDPNGHGTALAEIIGAAGRRVDWVIAQVFDARARATPAAIAAAISWALSHRVHLIHLSLGLQCDRQILSDAITEALGASVVVVASNPARGAATYPAAYPGVIRGTGDARCGPDEISALGTRQADYGACSQHQSSSGRTLRGASIGAAHLSRFIVRHAIPGMSGEELHLALRSRAIHLGPERRAG